MTQPLLKWFLFSFAGKCFSCKQWKKEKPYVIKSTELIDSVFKFLIGNQQNSRKVNFRQYGLMSFVRKYMLISINQRRLDPIWTQ